MKKTSNNFNEYDFYKLVCAITKYSYKEQIVDNIILSKICLNYDINNIYNNVKYSIDDNKQIIGINFHDALFAAASLSYVLVNESYKHSTSLILKDEKECQQIIESYGPDKFQAVLPIVLNLVTLQKEREQKQIMKTKQKGLK